MSGILSPRWVSYSALPGGAILVTRDGSGAFGTSGADGLDVRNNFRCGFCAEAGTAAAMSTNSKPKERKRILASDAGPRWRKFFSVETAVFTDATGRQMSVPVTSGQRQAIAPWFSAAPGNFPVVANYFSLPDPPCQARCSL